MKNEFNIEVFEVSDRMFDVRDQVIWNKFGFRMVPCDPGSRRMMHDFLTLASAYDLVVLTFKECDTEVFKDLLRQILRDLRDFHNFSCKV